VPASFVDEALKWRYSDLLFTAPLDGRDAFVYLLAGHQSSADPLMASGVALLRTVRLASSPAGRPLEINDTRTSGDELGICYPLSRDPSAQRRT
jgi:hypothetical protein